MQDRFHPMHQESSPFFGDRPVPAPNQGQIKGNHGGVAPTHSMIPYMFWHDYKRIRFNLRIF
jgi:hypothetical protein